MKISLSLVLFLNSANCQNVEDFVDAAQKILPNNFVDNLHKAVKPVKDAMEPYKVFETTHERGVPHLHEEYGKFLVLALTLILYRLRKSPRRPLMPAWIEGYSNSGSWASRQS